LDKCIKSIKGDVLLVLAELLFNIDETDFSNCEEPKPKYGLISIEVKATALHSPANPTPVGKC
jgi:hypothetical protein